MRLRRLHIPITDENHKRRWTQFDLAMMTMHLNPMPRGCVMTKTNTGLGLGGGRFTFTFHYYDDSLADNQTLVTA